MKKCYEYIISDVALEMSIDKFWRKKILELKIGEKIEFGYEDADLLPTYIKNFVLKHKLSFYVEIVESCEEDFDDGLVIFKFTSAEFNDVFAFSGNNPDIK